MSTPAPRPPVVLVHGAASSALVGRFWQPELAVRAWAMAAAACKAVACVGPAPSPPPRTRDASITIRSGVFGPEEYGIVAAATDRLQKSTNGS